MTDEEEVRALAHRLWVEEGQPEGRGAEHWLRAEAILREQAGAAAPRTTATLTAEPDGSEAPIALNQGRRGGERGKNLLAIASFLGQSRFFGVLTLDELRDLAASTEEFSCGPDTVVFKQADPGDRLFLLRAGRVKIVRDGPGEQELLLAIMQPGDVFGELSVVDGKARSATAVAMESVEAVTLHAIQFERFVRHRPDAGLRMMRVLTMRLRQADDALQDAAFAAVSPGT